MRVNQALFGYGEGHQMLAASTVLPRDCVRRLQIVTDQATVPGFESRDSYLTGLPLPEANSFALIRTWQAIEMQRPGCVWSHVLLLPSVFFDHSCNLATVNSLFSRPTRPNAFESYELILEASEMPMPAIWPSSFPGAYVLGSEFYKTDEPIICVVDDLSFSEQAVAWLWAQQWPQLRQKVGFSTAYFGRRTIGIAELDIQFVDSRKKEARPTYGTKEAKRIDLTIDTIGPSESWIHELVNSYFPITSAKSKSDLVGFLKKYGPDSPSQRSDMHKLAAIYSEWNHPPRMSHADAFALTFANYPEEGVCKRLKSAVSGSLTVEPLYQLFDKRASHTPRIDDVGDAAGPVWEVWSGSTYDSVQIKRAFLRLAEHRTGALWIGFWNHFAIECTESMFDYFDLVPISVIQQVAAEHADFLDEPAFWGALTKVESGDERFLNLYDHLTRERADNILSHLMRFGQLDTAISLAQKGPEAVMRSFVCLWRNDYYRNFHSTRSVTLRDIVYKHAMLARIYATEVNPSLDLLEILSPSLDLRQLNGPTELENWRKVADRFSSQLRTKPKTALLFLTLGLNTEGKPSRDLIKMSFDSAMDAMGGKVATAEVAQFAEHLVVPTTNVEYKFIMRPGEIQTYLAKKAVRDGWQASDVVGLSRNLHLVGKVVLSIEKQKEGRSLFDEVLDQIGPGAKKALGIKGKTSKHKKDGGADKGL